MNKQLFYVRVVQLIFILFLSFTIPVFGQTKVLEQVDTNLYQYRAFNEDGSIQQKGMYIKSEDGEYLPHSYWSDDVGTKGRYNKGKLVWIKPKGHPRYTYEQIEFEKMKARIEFLENKLASNKP